MVNKSLNKLALEPGEHEHLESLFANASFQGLAALNQRANSFELNTPTETDHCRILSWLLDPNEAHGLGGVVLHAFYGACKAAARRKPENDFFENVPLSTLMQSQSGVYIVCEQVTDKSNRVDIVIYCPIAKWAIAVEVKYGAKLASHQLSNYSAWIDTVLIGECQIPAGNILKIYLDKYEHKKTNTDKGWVEVNYDWLPLVIQDALKHSRIPTSHTNFLQDYVYYLNDSIGETEWYPQSEEEAASIAYEEEKGLLVAIEKLGLMYDSKTVGHRQGVIAALSVNNQRDQFALLQILRNEEIISWLEDYSGADKLAQELRKRPDLYGIEADSQGSSLDLRFKSWARFGSSAGVDEWPVFVRIRIVQSKKPDASDGQFTIQTWLHMDYEELLEEYHSELKKMAKWYSPRATKLAWVRVEKDVPTKEKKWPEVAAIAMLMEKLDKKMKAVTSSTMN